MAMKKILPFVLSLALLLALVAVPTLVAHAVDPTGTGGQGGTGTGGQTPGLQNPLKGVDSLADFFYQIANFVYSLSYAVIAIFLIWAGFKFVVAQGNEEKLKDAKKTLYYTLIGAAILIGANVLTEVVRTVINQFSKTQI